MTGNPAMERCYGADQEHKYQYALSISRSSFLSNYYILLLISLVVDTDQAGYYRPVGELDRLCLALERAHVAYSLDSPRMYMHAKWVFWECHRMKGVMVKSREEGATIVRA